MMCVRLWVCRCKRGLSSHRVSLKPSSDACSGQGLQMQERVVTEGVIVGGHLMRVRVGVHSTTSIFLFGYIFDLYFDLFLAEK